MHFRMSRAAVIVLDACGVGALPDAADYGDAGTNTLGHLSERAGGLRLPTLGALGLGCIVPLVGVPPVDDPVVHGRIGAVGPGKESVTGHWELMGVRVSRALPVYPEGFPADLVRASEDETGQRFCCNEPSSGTAVLDEFGITPSAHRRADPLHVGRLGAADRRARGRAARSRSVPRLRGGAPGDERRARGRASDRAAV